MTYLNNHRAPREDTPKFYAWCDEASRIEAFAAALSALVDPGAACSVMNSYVSTDAISVEEAVAVMRATFGAESYNSVFFSSTLVSGRRLEFSSHCCGEGAIRRGAAGTLEMSPFDKTQLLPLRLPIALRGGAREIEAEATLGALVAQDDVEDILLRFCAPDASTSVTMGGYTHLERWVAPIEMGATYHSNVSLVARDLALSWVHLHDKDRMELAVALSLDALSARIESAPQGARVIVAEGGTLTRESVLKAITTSPTMLLDALEASALPDDDWQAMEPRALEMIEATATDVPTYEVDLTTRRHVQFLQRHAPYHVRRLPNGGVLLATHPYRTLWPLYKDALFLLGITP